MRRRAAVALPLSGMACGDGVTAPPTTPTTPNAPPASGTTPGPTYVGANAWVEYAAGDLPIVLSAPHGGDLAPGEIPDRTAARCSADDDFSAMNDANTQALARLVADSLLARSGKRAHLVVSRLARRKLDANRDSLAASCGDAAAGRAWHEFQTFLDSARGAVARTGARGLYVDLHGHAHAIARVELRYLLRGADLDRTDAALDASATSLGALLAREGYAAVPGPGAPGPSGAPYFTGGYNTARHGCRDADIVCGVQAELPFAGVRDTDASRQRFAGALARALLQYARTHLGLALARS